jgi:TRAP-type mannitol/chloroaromatic compound transport system substrate-binding protein
MAYADGIVYMYELGAIDKHNEEFYHKYNAHLLAQPPHPGEPVHSTAPLPRLADLRGKKMRTSSMAALVYTHAGVDVTVISPPEIYTALERGVIDVVEYTSLATNIGMKLYEPAPYMIKPAHSTMVCGHTLCVNKKNFDALPQMYQDLVQLAAIEMSFRVIGLNRKMELDLMTHLDDYGIIWTHWPQEDFDELAQYSLEVWNDKYEAINDFGKWIIQTKMDYAALIKEWDAALCH